MDVELHLGIARDLGEPAPKLVRFGTPTADDDARPGGVHIDPEAIPGAFDLNTGNGRVGHLRHQVVADAPILDEVIAVLLAIGEPAGLPIGGDTKSETVGIDLLAHYSVSSASPTPPGAEKPAASAASTEAK